MEQDISVEVSPVSPGELASIGLRAVRAKRCKIGEQRAGVQVAPAKGDRQVRGGVHARDVVQLLVVTDSILVTVAPLVPGLTGTLLAGE